MKTPPILKKFNFSDDWILYQDSDIIVVNKPSGLLSVPGRGADKFHSLYSLLCEHFGEVFIVHRLDMDTSGLMVVARNKLAHRQLSIQFQDRKTEKYYEAICAGKPLQQKGCISLPMRCDWENRPRQMVDPLQGKSAQTYWEIMQEFKINQQCFFSVRLTPITGRSHQLRLHMKSLGHPILGDNLYADTNSLKTASRLLLHAKFLEFRHPMTHELRHFTCPHSLENNLEDNTKH